jgi:hypothetical protein
MDIRNVTQFSQFLSANNLVRLDPLFGQLTQCFNNYAAGCNCHKRSDKIKVYEVCNKLYMTCCQQLISRHKGEFLNATAERQIAFYSEHGQLMVIVSR